LIEPYLSNGRIKISHKEEEGFLESAEEEDDGDSDEIAEAAQ
jgi:hypothetical protein